MRNKSKNFIYIDRKPYDSAFEQYIINTNNISGIYPYLISTKFDTEIGLIYAGMSSIHVYKFTLKNKKKWFLAKIKYGL